MRLAGFCVFGLACGIAYGQDIISARAGLIHHTDGRVLLDNKPIARRVTQFMELRDNGQLRTEQGRAEILLTPGVFLRLSENSGVEMVSSRLTDVRVRLLTGSAVVEADEVDKATSITLLAGSSEVLVPRAGLYRLDLVEQQAPRLRVFAGEAVVRGPSGELRVKSSREVDLAADAAIRKFNAEDTDPLDRWSKRRAGYLAAANVSAGRMAYAGGMSFNSSRWMWNPYYSMYTFLPYREVCWSPYGYGFYSPRAVYYMYNPPRAPSSFESASAGRSYNPSYGYSTVQATSAGTSGVVASSPSSPATQGGGAAISRGGDSGGGGARR